MTRYLRALLLLGIAGCAISMGTPNTRADHLPVALFDATGSRVGTVTLTMEGNDEALTLVFDVYGLPPGSHGLHIHAVGSCQRPDFLSAGPHLDEGEHQHGLDNPKGPHFGDLPDLIVNEDGTAHRTLRLAPKAGHIHSSLLFGGDGSSIVIHADPDDRHTDPSGNSGIRIACGILN